MKELQFVSVDLTMPAVILFHFLFVGCVLFVKAWVLDPFDTDYVAVAASVVEQVGNGFVLHFIRHLYRN